MEPFDLRLWAEFDAAGGKSDSPAIIDQITVDSRRIDSPHALFVALKGNSYDGHQFISNAAKTGARYALVQKDWVAPQNLENICLLRVEDPLRSFQNIASTYRQQQPATILAITGSYGKTMLKDLLHAILSTAKQTVVSPESFNSQIGVALSLLQINRTDEIAIIEAGISMKGEMPLLASMIAPHYAILTNIGKAHIATLNDLETTAEEKLKLFSGRVKPEWILLPNDPILHSYTKNLASDLHYWNDHHASFPHATSLSDEPNAVMPYKIVFPDGNIHFGEITSGFSYYIDLINMAIKAAWLLKIPSKNICEALTQYIPESMRTEIWKSPDRMTFINDTYCSDPQSVDKALKHFSHTPAHHRKVFAFGGFRENNPHISNDYRHVGKAIVKSGIDLLILFNNHSYTPLVEEIAANAPNIEIALCPTYNDAIKQMRLRVKQDDMVLIKGPKKESLDKLAEAFNDSIHSNQCIIDLEAVQANIEAMRNKIGQRKRILVMVKALAYGTDSVRMSKFLQSYGIDILGVSYVEEGVDLRREGISQAIFVLNAAIYEAAKVVKWDLEVGVSDIQMIHAIAKEAAIQNKVIKVHLHVDTGMSRFGCRPKDALPLAKLIKTFASLALEGIMTHFASADDPEDDNFTLAQIKCFDQTISTLKSEGITIPWSHAANSAALMRFELPQYDMVRVGLGIYGLNPSEAARNNMELRLALSLISRIVGINTCKKGESISYGRAYTAQRENERIAVLPIGYFDGLHRNYSGKSYVIIRGQKARMVGKICMDFMMVDVTEIPNAEVGDTALIFGSDEYGYYRSPEDLANCGGSIVHELITCLGPRIQRIFIKG